MSKAKTAFVSEGRGKPAIGLKYLWIPAILNCLITSHVALHGGVAILAVDINYANYICAISVLLAYSHKYRARINNQLYGTYFSQIFATEVLKRCCTLH